VFTGGEAAMGVPPGDTYKNSGNRDAWLDWDKKFYQIFIFYDFK